MLLLLYLLIIIIGFAVRVPRRWYWLICTAVLCLLVNTSDACADLSSYTYIFNSIGEAGLAYSGTTPIGWTVLCLFFYKLGFSYRGMIIFVILLCMFLIHYSLKDYSISEGRFWAMFLVFPALAQCVQMRFFLATSIVFFALQFMLKKGKKGLIPYIIGVIVATLIHTSCLVFIAFVLVAFFEKINFRKVMTVSVILSVIVAVFRSYLLSFISLLSFIPQEKLIRYFYEDAQVATTRWIILMAGTYFACVAFVWFFKNQTKRPVVLETSAYIQEEKYVLNRMVSFVCLLTFTLPLMLFDASMYRFIEVGMYVTFCMAGWYWKNSGKRYLEKLIVLLVLCIPLYYVLRNVASVSNVLEPFFTFSGFNSLLR